MGYALIMFGVLLIMSVVMVTAVDYGIAKDSQVAPLKAENIYAERETGKAQTGLTIVDTCLGNSGRYLKGSGNENPSGPHTLYLTVRNNGSIVLNSTKATVLYNNSYRSFTVTSGNVWTPLTNASMQVSNIYIPTPGSPDPYVELRLLVAAENGISAIAPTSPTNFNIYYDSGSDQYTFSWNASKDDTGIGYYLIYEFDTTAPTSCPINPTQILWIAGKQNSLSSNIPCPRPCKTRFFFITTVDLGGNMAIQSRTLRCTGASGNCDY